MLSIPVFCWPKECHLCEQPVPSRKWESGEHMKTCYAEHERFIHDLPGQCHGPERQPSHFWSVHLKKKSASLTWLLYLYFFRFNLQVRQMQVLSKAVESVASWRGPVRIPVSARAQLREAETAPRRRKEKGQAAKAGPAEARQISVFNIYSLRRGPTGSSSFAPAT